MNFIILLDLIMFINNYLNLTLMQLSDSVTKFLIREVSIIFEADSLKFA